ncbi:alpha-crystallin A chain-like [Cimex lectularius]|uniref:SHSP domain-containing protein n=1 Tax=Cimex lectularius TaxID=79782 RepID=A0A8I6TJ32_CIMLE|nr:alpha-crystallin A chain-like [Cimex lectularius]
MSLLPVLFNELLDTYHRPVYDLSDQHFGLGLMDDDLRPCGLLQAPLRCGYVRPWRNLLAGDSGLSSIVSNKDEFKVNLDVQQFKPDELKVKVENDMIVVDGKHEERSDEHGFISRQFTRKYRIPKDVDLNALKSNLSSDGVLSLQAPKVSKENDAREIPIVHTNAPAVKQKKQNKEKQENGEK